MAYSRNRIRTNFSRRADDDAPGGNCGITSPRWPGGRRPGPHRDLPGGHGDGRRESPPAVPPFPRPRSSGFSAGGTGRRPRFRQPLDFGQRAGDAPVDVTGVDPLGVQEYPDRGRGAVTGDIELAVIVVRSLGSPFQMPAFPVDPEPCLRLPGDPGHVRDHAHLVRSGGFGSSCPAGSALVMAVK
jgi:hypothetical protein